MKILSVNNTYAQQKNIKGNNIAKPAFGRGFFSYSHCIQNSISPSRGPLEHIFDNMTVAIKYSVKKAASYMTGLKFSSAFKKIKSVKLNKKDLQGQAVIDVGQKNVIIENMNRALKFAEGNHKREKKLFNHSLRMLIKNDITDVDICISYAQGVKQFLKDNKYIDLYRLEGLFKRFEAAGNPIKKGIYAELVAINDSKSINMYAPFIRRYLEATPGMQSKPWAQRYLNK